MRIEEFDYSKYDGDSIFVVYGTAIFGEITHYCLKQHNIVPDYYVNQNGQGLFHGVSVIQLDELAKIYHEKQTIVLLAAGNSSRDIMLNLKKKNIDKVYSVCDLIDEIKEMKEILSPEYKRRFIYQYQQMSFANNEQLIMYSLDVVVTEKCSLKCINCSNLMQYYDSPKDIDIEIIKYSLDKLLETVDYIYELRFLGGEPFMNPEFHLLIDQYKGNKKIKKIVIYTNGTIFPSENVRNQLIDSKMIIRISDYGVLSKKLGEWSQWCECNNIDYDVLEATNWHDLGRLEKHCYSLDEKKYIYQTCECNDVPTLINRRLYNCPYAANAVNLGAIYDDEAQQDFLEINDDKELKSRVKKFLFDRDFLMACDYCEGRCFSRASVKAYVQTKNPLVYIKRIGVNYGKKSMFDHNSCV